MLPLVYHPLVFSKHPYVLLCTSKCQSFKCVDSSGRCQHVKLWGLKRTELGIKSWDDPGIYRIENMCISEITDFILLHLFIHHSANIYSVASMCKSLYQFWGVHSTCDGCSLYPPEDVRDLQLSNCHLSTLWASEWWLGCRRIQSDSARLGTDNR